MNPQVVKVVIEYSPQLQRVIVRGVFSHSSKVPEILSETHDRNVVTVFMDVDMGWHVGFTGLVPSEQTDQPQS